MSYSGLKRLFITGAFLGFLHITSAQVTEPWQTLDVGLNSTGIGLALDSNNIYTAANLQSGTYSSYLFKINRTTGESDSILISKSDTASFLPFYIYVDDSLVVYLGGVYDWTKSGNDPTSRRCAIVRLRKDLSFKDSVVFQSPGTDIWHFIKLGSSYFVTEGGVNASRKLTKIRSNYLKIDTSIVLPPLSYTSLEMSLAFSDSLNKMLVMASPGRLFVIDTNSLTIDSTFISWNTNFPYGPDVVDFFSWDRKLISISNPWGVRLYHYHQDGQVYADHPVFVQDTLPGAENYIRGCYGFSDSLLIFSTSGPFTAAPPMQTNTITHIQIFAVNKKGETIWQNKINNGRNNLVYSHCTDDKNTFIYVRSIDGSDQEMFIYKLDASGNILGLNELQNNEVAAINFFPNPTEGKVFYSASSLMDNTKELTFELFNSLGQRCFQKVVPPIEGSFDLHSLPRGSYSYKFIVKHAVVRSGLLILK